MAKSPKKPKLSTGKASKPELKPLDPYLADLLNPAVNREREAAKGFAERAQETFIHGDIADVDPALAKKLGLKGPDDGPDVAEELGELSPGSGVSATVDALTRLLTEGDPRFKDGKAWVPHRPPRPEKSEGGIPFRIQSDFTPSGDQPTAIRELVDGVRRAERDQVPSFAKAVATAAVTPTAASAEWTRRMIHDATKASGQAQCLRALPREDEGATLGLGHGDDGVLDALVTVRPARTRTIRRSAAATASRAGRRGRSRQEAAGRSPAQRRGSTARTLGLRASTCALGSRPCRPTREACAPMRRCSTPG